MHLPIHHLPSLRYPILSVYLPQDIINSDIFLTDIDNTESYYEMLQTLWGKHLKATTSNHWKGCLVLEFKSDNYIINSIITDVEKPAIGPDGWGYINIACDGTRGKYTFGYICEYGYLLLMYYNILYLIIVN